MLRGHPVGESMDPIRSNGAQEERATEATGPDDPQYQELWFSLGRRAWSSVVLVPADRAGSADEVAQRLAEVGKRLSRSPVTVVTAKSLEYGTALALADLPSFVDQRGAARQASWQAMEMPPSSIERPAAPEQEVAAGPESILLPPASALPQAQVPPEGGEGLLVSAGARLIISIPPVVSQPLGLATAQAADLVVLCVEVGVTRLADARRTLELVGRERVAGCFLIH